MSLSSRWTRLILSFFAVAALGLTALQAPALASAIRGDADPATCTTAELRELQAAGDNFADRCLLPGQELAGLRTFKADAPEGVVKSPDLNLVAEVPLAGAFAADGSYGTDLAFRGKFAFDGNYNGFTVYNIKNPTKPRRVAQVVCPGSQNDVSVYRNVLILSVDSSRSDDSCASVSQSASEKSSWEGLRVFDISNPKKPKYIAAVETDCGSHTHTVAPSHRGKALFVYVSSYSPNADYPDCQPPHDFVSVVKVPLKNLKRSRVVSKPVLFPDGGNNTTSGCHDITAYPARDLAAGACMGDGILMDIKKRNKPIVIDRVTDDVNFSFWHSATFNNSGTKVVYTDELGGGSAPTCNPILGSTRGANGIYDVVGNKLIFKSYYKMPRTQLLTENCVAHNGSLVPVKGKDIMVQAWYQGGIEVFDFTDSANPVQIAYYDNPAISETELILGGVWSAYWYNGYVYASDITRGFGVYKLTDPLVAPAQKVRFKRFNAQSQPGY
ncbi:LVIVD repeat-containing protein [Nocardioides sp.]|uniref:LVIVD repeat-containing protein n=1 Tax=Nocardioides sp. TaxID=35761 RepID=UPI0035616BB3